MKIRILLTGADSDYAIERFYLKYMAKHPDVSDIGFFPAQNYFLDYYRKNSWNKLFYRLGVSHILKKINRQLLKTVSEFKPDVIVVFKGMEIFPETLEKLHSSGIRLVNYNPDNPFVFTSRGSGNKNVSNSIRKFDLYMSYDKTVCDRLSNDLAVRSVLLPFGFDLSDPLFDKIRSEAEIVKVCFIGNHDGMRLSLLNGLAENDIKIDLYGLGWKRRKLHENITLHGYLSGELMLDKLRRYRVQLNILRIHNLKSHNMRTFEIPAVGGIQLAPATPDHSSFFEENREIFLYTDLRSCVEKIKYLLCLPAADALKIRSEARARCLNSRYSYENRSDLMISSIMKLF